MPGPPEEPGNGPLEVWRRLVREVQEGRREPLVEMRRIFGPGIRFHLRRRLGTHAEEEHTGAVIELVCKRIVAMGPMEAGNLPALVTESIGKHVSDWLQGGAVMQREQLDEVASPRANHDHLDTAFHLLANQEREVLTRFYLLEQSREQICAEMNLSLQALADLKAAARNRFAQLSQAFAKREPPDNKRDASGRAAAATE